ncbi:MAG TPA: WYL domain-containing protein [Blastocatellia bacterium]|jgi:predicted DNA-binding transcriptional regulator YafY
MVVELSNKRREKINHLERVFWIDHEIRTMRYPTTRTIAEHFEISTKTAQRTLDFMRDRLRLPLAYSTERKGWYYTEPTFGLPAIELTEGDLVAILLSERLAREYRGLAIGRQVEQTFAKVLNCLTNVVSIDFQSLIEAYSFEVNATVEVEPEVFKRLGRAAIERRRIQMTYYTAARGEVTERQADPLHLRSHLSEWYLIAFDHLRREVRDFHIGRIRELTILDERFDWPQGFDLSAYLDSGFGMVRGREPFQVEIVFDEYQARWIRERGPVHPTEQREELPRGELLIRMKVTALDGVKRFVMQYGSHARVIASEQLRQAIREESEAMSALYKSD